MNRNLLLSAAAVAILGLGASACTKGQQASTANATDSAASSRANVTGNAVATTEGSGPVSDVQDAAGKVVGMASAAMPTNTQGFVDAAGIGDMFEIAAAKMAATQASSAEIKTFAKQMIKDHTKTSTELKAMIGKTVQATPPAKLDQRRQGMLDNLKSSKDGHEFDKRYVNQQGDAHREMLTLMKGFADHGDNDALKAFAAKTAPAVQMHLDMAKKLDSEPHNAGAPGGNDPAVH